MADSDSNDSSFADDIYGEINEYLSRLIWPNDPKYRDGFKEDLSHLPSMEQQIAWQILMTHHTNFGKWELLPVEVRSSIAAELDFMTRFSLMLVSSSNYNEARSVPMIIDTISVSGDAKIIADKIKADEKRVRVDLKTATTAANFWFVEKGDDTKVIRYWITPNTTGSGWGTMLLKNRNYFKESELFVERLLVLTNYKVKELKIKMLDWGETLTVFNEVQIKKELVVRASAVDYPVRLLDCAHSPLDKLRIVVQTPCDFSEFVTNTTIRSAKKFTIDVVHRGLTSTSFTEADLLGLNCEEVFTRGVNISSTSINTFMKRWIDGGGPENFRRAQFSLPNTVHKQEILENIDVFKWDRQFKTDNLALKEWAKRKFPGLRYYYIESKRRNNGATLAIGPNQAVFLVTGKRL